MRIEQLYELYKQSYKVVKDTRDDVDAAIYFSLKGESFNGNKYAKQALDNGANYAVIDEAEYQTDKRMILVDSVLKCLQDLARYHRKQLKIPILALTGSNGKTTTKELVNIVLKEKYNCYATQGNLNNHIGVPLTLLSMKPDHDFGIVEMGANHQGEISELCGIALPDFGLITNFGRVHLEGFGSYEGVIKGKTEMYNYIRTRGKKAFVNATDSIQMEHSTGMDRITFGTNNSTFPVLFSNADPFVKLKFEDVQVSSNLIGRYNYDNIATAIAIGKYFDINNMAIKKAVESFIPENNRSQIIEKDSNKIIMDAYNANPNSMVAAIENLSHLSDKNKVAILGDMFEIGKDRLIEHQKISDLLEESVTNEAYLIGESFAEIKVASGKIRQFVSFDKFKEFFNDQNYKETTFLIKASRGMKLERVLDLL